MKPLGGRKATDRGQPRPDVQSTCSDRGLECSVNLLLPFRTVLGNQHAQHPLFKQLSLGLNIKPTKEQFFLKAQHEPKVNGVLVTCDL